MSFSDIIVGIIQVRDMKLNIFFVVGLCMGWGTFAFADVAPFSQYGVIQNVQNYSSNPHWNPNSPYNLNMPTPVYAKGPSITTADCQNIVAALVVEQCLLRSDNCRSAQLKDIRPAVMVQLSRMPNGNYATACVGYLDDTFDQYVKNNSFVRPSGGFAASLQNGGAVVQNPNVIDVANDSDVVENNSVPQWASDMAQRRQELKELQGMTAEMEE